MYCRCCPCCKTTSEKPQSIKYTALPTRSSVCAVDDARRVFKFPQSASSTMFPPMFKRDSEVITEQPHTKTTNQILGNDGTGHSRHKFIPKSRRRDRIQSLAVADNSNRESLLMAAVKDRSASLQEGKLYGWNKQTIIQFSLLYDVVHCTLMVHLHYALNLPAMDRNGKSDPFVVVGLTPNCTNELKSKVVPETLNPVFNQSLQFQNIFPGDLRNQTLQLSVYDHDKLKKNDWIGEVTLPLADVDLTGVAIQMNIDLDDHHSTKEGSTNGNLLIALSYDTIGNSLEGVVLKATALPKRNLVGLSDPYVRVLLVHKGRFWSDWRSSVKCRTLNPIFNESFRFDLLDRHIQDIQLDVLVVDNDRKRDDIMGLVKFNRKSSPASSANKQWEEMLLSPQFVSQWHSLQSDDTQMLR